MGKGEQTREAVLREALRQSSNVGLHGITIGVLADALGMSKSGLFAHFRSKEQLQVDVLDYAAGCFERLVVLPAIQQSRGEPRLRTLLDRWLGWGGFSDYALPGGCIFVAATTEFDDLPDGPVRDRVVQHRERMNASIARMVRSAIAEGHLREDVDPEQFAYELNGIMLSYLTQARLLRDDRAAPRARRAFDRLLDQARELAATPSG